MDRVSMQTKTQARVMSMLKTVAIVITIAVLYSLVTGLTLSTSYTGGVWPGFRPANALRSLAIVTPLAGPGLGLAQVYTTMATGVTATPFSWVLAFLNYSVGVLTWRLAQKGPQKGIMMHVKNILLISFYATIIAIAVRVNLTLLKFPIFFSEAGLQFFMVGVVGKVMSGIGCALMGYPLIKGWQKMKEYVDSKGM